MSVDSVGGTTGTGSSSGSSSSTNKNQELGQDAFLQLMVAQMKNQDPTKPADPTQFLSQLAQFSTVSGIESMKDSISTLSDSLRSSQVLGGTSLVGHVVLADGDEASLGADGSVYGSATIPEGTSDAYMLVSDSSGQQVARVPLSTTSGDQTFTWDGTNGLGARAAAGDYTIKAYANVGGKETQLTTQLASYVNSVSIDPSTNALTLNTDIGSIALSDVREVM